MLSWNTLYQTTQKLHTLSHFSRSLKSSLEKGQPSFLMLRRSRRIDPHFSELSFTIYRMPLHLIKEVFQAQQLKQYYSHHLQEIHERTTSRNSLFYLRGVSIVLYEAEVVILPFLNTNYELIIELFLSFLLLLSRIVVYQIKV